MNYKKIKKLVPFCEKCQSEIQGNGSVLLPYHCKCGKYKYDNLKKDFILQIK